MSLLPRAPDKRHERLFSEAFGGVEVCALSALSALRVLMRGKSG